ncbi:hypothetical protein D3C71_1673920 [compost metagenome]
MVETATVNLPLLAVGSNRQIGSLLQAKVERDEIKRRTDPRDTGDDVQPSHGKGEPIPGYGILVHAILPFLRGVLCVIAGGRGNVAASPTLSKKSI